MNGGSTAPAPLRNFPRLPFSRGSSEPAAFPRAIPAARRAAHYSEFIHMSFETLGLSQPVLQALALKEYTHADADPGAGDPDPAQGPRPARHRPDRHRQDRRLHAAVDRPAGRRRQARRSPRACRMLVLAPTRELASQIAESARAYSRFSRMSGRHRVRRHLDRQEPAGRSRAASTSSSPRRAG